MALENRMYVVSQCFNQIFSWPQMIEEFFTDIFAKLKFVKKISYLNCPGQSLRRTTTLSLVYFNREK